MKYNVTTAQEAALMVDHGNIIGFSGFTAAGCSKVVPEAIAKRAEQIHAKGEPFKIGIYTGASTHSGLDGALAKANAVEFRTPYQSCKELRKRINDGDTKYFDKHLSQLAQELRYGFLKPPQIAIVEACQLSDDGEIVLTDGVGITPTLCKLADKIIIELNEAQPKELRGLHDIYEPLDPPNRREIPIYSPRDRIGSDCVKVDPKKIVAVVKTNMPPAGNKFAPISEVTKKIGDNVANFLAQEMKKGRIPKSFLPIQSGVGNTANALLNSLGEHPDIPPFMMYTEVIQDVVIEMMKKGRCKFASGCSLTLSADMTKEVYADLEFYKKRIILRPEEISNNPELARRMGLITINTALEADILGNINSTHVLGQRMMNGIGGSGDFTSNAYLSIYTVSSLAKDGKISTIVPKVSHVDHTGHSVKVIVTEHGVADLRGKSPKERAELLVNNCVAPEYRDMFRKYLSTCPQFHTPFNIDTCYNMHKALRDEGDMHLAKF